MCLTISFSRSCNIKTSEYKIDNQNLERRTRIRNRGIIFCSDPSFGDRIMNVINKAVKSLGFVIRNLSNFDNLGKIKTLYFTFVRSLVKSLSIIWSSYQDYLITRLERVQNRFFMFC